MSKGKNEITKTQKVSALKSYLQHQEIQNRLSDLMTVKEKQQFIGSIISAYADNDTLLECTPKSVIGSALVAATLNLAINQNLGHAYLVPYNNTSKGVKEAQFQLGYKGLIQLCLRTGQYRKLNVIEVYKSQFTSFDRLTEELDANFSEPGDGEVVGYAAYMELENFKKTVFWTKEEVEAHAKRYSYAYRKGYNTPWKSNFDGMAKKTVLKNMLNKWGIMSTQMKTAQLEDQKVFSDLDQGDYLDNPNDEESEETPKTKTEQEFEKARKEAEDVDGVDDVEDNSDLKGTPLE